jgi:cold-inducible RNA-binding protein
MKIFVGNFDFSMDDAQLRTLFEPFGAVESASVVTDRNTGRSRGFGFVEMNDADATKAIAALNGSEQGGRALNVNQARPKTESGGGRSWSNDRGGRGGGGGKSRRW